MTKPLRHRPLEVERVGDLALVRFTLPKIMDLSVIRLVGKQLASLVEAGGRRRVLLSFRGVDRLSTPLVGEVIKLHKQLDAAGGQLALCDISDDLFTIFDLLNLPKMLEVFPEEKEALFRLQPAAV
jgi:stage II sporulation protein AA (anti-sigma F factor antagonist)